MSCDHIGKQSTILGPVERAALTDHRVTDFMVLQCQECGQVFGYPQCNFDLALNEGTPQTRYMMKQIIERQPEPSFTDQLTRLIGKTEGFIKRTITDVVAIREELENLKKLGGDRNDEPKRD